MTLFFLAVNPDCLKKAQEEVDTCFETEDNKDSFRPSHLSKLKYLRMCIKEAMRLHPPVPVIGRAATENIMLGWLLLH